MDDARNIAVARGLGWNMEPFSKLLEGIEQGGVVHPSARTCTRLDRDKRTLVSFRLTTIPEGKLCPECSVDGFTALLEGRRMHVMRAFVNTHLQTIATSDSVERSARLAQSLSEHARYVPHLMPGSTAWPSMEPGDVPVAEGISQRAEQRARDLIREVQAQGHLLVERASIDLVGRPQRDRVDPPRGSLVVQGKPGRRESRKAVGSLWGAWRNNPDITASEAANLLAKQGSVVDEGGLGALLQAWQVQREANLQRTGNVLVVRDYRWSTPTMLGDFVTTVHQVSGEPGRWGRKILVMPEVVLDLARTGNHVPSLTEVGPVNTSLDSDTIEAFKVLWAERGNFADPQRAWEAASLATR